MALRCALVVALAALAEAEVRRVALKKNEDHEVKATFSLRTLPGAEAPIVIKGPEGGRRNIMQRNVARSTGARSGSNNNKGNN